MVMGIPYIHPLRDVGYSLLLLTTTHYYSLPLLTHHVLMRSWSCRGGQLMGSEYITSTCRWSGGPLPEGVVVSGGMYMSITISGCTPLRRVCMVLTTTGTHYYYYSLLLLLLLLTTCTHYMYSLHVLMHSPFLPRGVSVGS
jgi:hypothetical protein